MSRAHLFVPSSDEFTLTAADIIADPATGLPVYSWSSERTVFNKIDAFYDYDVLVAEDFSRRQVWTSLASVERYGAQPAIQMLLRGVRNELDGEDLLTDLAYSLLQRWGYPPPILRLSTAYRRHPIEILDSLRVTHALIKNPLTGQLGLTRERFEVLNVSPRWLTQGRVDATLIWTGAIETSAVPTTPGPFSLVAGVSVTDPTDTAVPFGSSITVTTDAAWNTVGNHTQLTIGLSQRSYRVWDCEIHNFRHDGAKDGCGNCCVPSNGWVNASYTSKVTYHLEYKKTTAPDAPGTGTDPATGWVTLKASAERGTVAKFDDTGCAGSSSVDPSLPSADTWSETFTLTGGPAKYNVKIFFDAIATQANPCSGFTSSCGDVNPTCSGTVASSTLDRDIANLVLDAVTVIA